MRGHHEGMGGMAGVWGPSILDTCPHDPIQWALPHRETSSAMGTQNNKSRWTAEKVHKGRPKDGPRPVLERDTANIALRRAVRS